MRGAGRRALGWTAGVGLLVVLLFSGGAAQAATKRPPTASAALRTLVTQTAALPRTATSATRRATLLRTARHARRVATAQPCGAVADLVRYRTLLRPIRVKKGKRYAKLAARVARLGPASVLASSRLLASKRTKACGGGVAPSTRSQTKTSVLKSDTNGMEVRVQLPAVRFVPRTGGGRSWTQLTIPDSDAPSAPGTPAIPVSSSTFGVPDGAKVTVKAGETTGYSVGGVDVYPAQPDVVDADTPAPSFLKPPFSDKPFQVDDQAYNKKGLVPGAPADGGVLGTVRDVTLGSLHIPAAQYDAAAHRLKVLTSVDVHVAFTGGSHAFSDELASPWEQAARRLTGTLLNSSVVNAKIRYPFRRCGEELLVITNPSTRSAADTFATAKRAQGLRTAVVEVGSDPGQIGTTATDVQTYIRGELNRLLCIHPSYVTIVGDDKLVPTFTATPGGIPSDLQYAMRNDADELPDVAVGRIIGNDLAQVTTAVTKIIGYETTVPGGAAYLNHATIAAQFQDDDNDGTENRTFVWFAETVRNGLVRRGVTVDRVYGESPGNNPQKLNDGTPLPAALLKPTFGWNGTGADVSADWNAGRFLVIHRDHGWSDGWGTPGYGTADVQALTNGSLLPVVMSINCSSAAYDYDDTSFAQESLVKADGGSVGVFGDTRDSPSWHNSQLGLGLVDALLPSVLPGEGPATAQRTGDALINGKLRLAGLSSPTTDGDARSEMYLWHYFGDPTMKMWGGGHAPFLFDPSRFKALFLAKVDDPPPGDPPPYGVQVTLPPELKGQTVSLLRNGQVIGKAVAGDGQAVVPAEFGDGSVKPGDLQVALDPDESPPVLLGVDGVPAGSTQLAQACPAGGTLGTPLTVSGTLAGAPVGATVDVTFTAPTGRTAGRVVVVHATTDASGHWSASVTPEAGEQGTWTVGSSFAATGGLAGSTAGPCSVTVTKIATTLTQSVPSQEPYRTAIPATGTLSGAPAGAEVVVTFTPPAGTGSAQTKIAVVDAKGNWSAVSDQPTAAQSNGQFWSVSSAYAGDGLHAGSTAGPNAVFSAFG